MTDGRALVAAFMQTLERRDWRGFGVLLDEHVVYEIPQTRERIRGRDRYVRFNSEYPGDWHLEPLVMLGDDRFGSVLFRWTLGDRVSLGASFFEFHAGLVSKITDLWPESYEPPPGREHLVERW